MVQKILRVFREDLIKFYIQQYRFYDDYAHHPTEIKVVLEGVKKVYKNYEKVWYFNLIEFQD